MKKAVLLIGFGGPEKAEDVRPFLESVLEGIQIPQARFDEVLHHYELVGNVSLFNSITYKQKEALESWLKKQGSDLSVGVGFRHSFPSLKDAFETLKKYNVEEVIGFVLSPLRSYPSFGKYTERVEKGKIEAGAAAIGVVYAEPFFDHPLFIECQAARIAEAGIDPKRIFTIFSAHSIPTTRSDESGYADQFQKLSASIAQKAGLEHWAVAYQSRSGNPKDPWLEPDVKKVIASLDTKKFEGVCLVPCGFLCDNVEVTYDLDIEAKEACQTAGLRYSRAAAAGDHPLFIEMAGRQILQTQNSYTPGVSEIKEKYA